MFKKKIINLKLDKRELKTERRRKIFQELYPPAKVDRYYEILLAFRFGTKQEAENAANLLRHKIENELLDFELK